jgi:hypothetical protein
LICGAGVLVAAGIALAALVALKAEVAVGALVEMISEESETVVDAYMKTPDVPADILRAHDFVGFAMLQDAVLMDARLVRKGVGADYRVLHGGISLSKRDPAGFMRDWAEDAFQVEAIWRREGELTSARKSALLRRLGKTTRLLYELDRSAFWRVYRRMLALDPGYIPETPRSLRLASRLFGYPRAEALAMFARRGRQVLRGTG